MGKEKRLLPIKEAFQLAGAAASPEPGEAGGGEKFTKKKKKRTHRKGSFCCVFVFCFFFFCPLTNLYSAFFQNHDNELLLVIQEEMYTRIFQWV